GNVVSGNQEVGVITLAGEALPIIKGNILGPQIDGVTPIASSTQQVGVYVGAGRAQVGGTNAGDGNSITQNDDPRTICPPPSPPATGTSPCGGAGVYVVGGNNGTTILGNSIFSNGDSVPTDNVGIFLEPTANHDQAAPTITTATSTGSAST